MNEVAAMEKSPTVFTDDLKTMVHIAQNEPEVDLMKAMLFK